MTDEHTQNSDLITITFRYDDPDSVVFKFAEGEMVKHRDAMPHVNLPAGAIGKVWALYCTEPPGYEVQFRDEDGVDFSMVVFEPELEKVGQA